MQDQTNPCEICTSIDPSSYRSRRTCKIRLANTLLAQNEPATWSEAGSASDLDALFEPSQGIAQARPPLVPRE